jgi:hypothetical protein
VGFALLAAVVFGAGATARCAASNTVPAALADALVRDADVAPCAQSAHASSNAAYASANFRVRSVTLRSGPRMSVLTGGGSCVCGNVNCKVAVFEREGDAYRSVLSGYAIRSDVRPDGTAVITSHDSAAVVFRSTYRWNGKLYVAVKTEMVYVANNVAKPASRTVKFAPGTSSAMLSGNRIALGFEDRFDFDAASGQTVTLQLVKHDSLFGSFSVLRDDATIGRAERGSLVAKLPASGTYHVVVEGGGDGSFSAYALRLTIR